MSLRSSLIEHAAAQAAMQPWIEMECIQLSQGKCLGELHSLDLGNKRIVRERQEAAVQKLGSTPDNLCTISYCTMDPAFRFSEHGAGNEDTIFFMPEKTEFDLHVPAGAQTTYVSLDQDQFLDAARVLNPGEWENAPQGIKLLHSRQKVLFQDAVEVWFRAAGMAATQRGAPGADIMRRLLFQTVLQVATTTTRVSPEAVPTAARLRAFHICRQARSFAEDRLVAEEPPTIVDICRAVGVSERTLQYAFCAYAGMSPMAYLRRVRLNRVRTMLQRSSPRDTTVTAVALRFGFFHFGRFSQDYKRFFHETPSVTLAC